MSRAKIDEITLDALRTRQSLVKGERLVRDEMRAVLHVVSTHLGSPRSEIRDAGKHTPAAPTPAHQEQQEFAIAAGWIQIK